VLFVNELNSTYSFKLQQSGNFHQDPEKYTYESFGLMIMRRLPGELICINIH